MSQVLLNDAFERFLAYGMAIRNYRPITIRNYRDTFRLFIQESHAIEIDDLSKELVEKWFFNGRLKRSWSSVTFRHHHKHLNMFFKWLLKEGLIPKNYLADLEKPRMEKKIPRTLCADDAKLVLEASFHAGYRYKFEKYRNRAVIAIMLFAGLRRGEVMNLKLNDVNLENRSIFINQGKGAKDRVIPINSRLYTYLVDYAKERNRLKPYHCFFFISLGRLKAFGEKGINNLIKRLRKQTELDFSAHTLRHSFATLMLEGGCDIYTLSKIMGHSKITTTTIYLSCSNQQMSKGIEMHYLN